MISVIMSARSAERFIRPAIESILAQTYSDFEFIIVDNNSTDNTFEIINEYAEKDARIKSFQYREGGWTGAVNQAMRMAKYNWIARIDADDVALPHRFERQIQAIRECPEIILWGSFAYQINIFGERIGVVEHGPTTEAEFEAVKSSGKPVYILNPTTMFRKDIALQLGGFNEKITSGGDEELWARMLHYGPMRVIPEHLIEYRIHLSSISTTRSRYQMHVLDFIEARSKAWKQGGDLEFFDYLSALDRRPLYRRLQTLLNESGRSYYRRSGAYLGEKRYFPAVFYMFLALICAPHFTIQRIYKRTRRKNATYRFISR